MSRSKSTRLAILVSCLLMILASDGIGRSETSGRPKNTANLLYVANTGDNSVEVFPIGKFGNFAPFGPPPRLSNPSGIAHDASNNIYVANTGSNEITVCEPFAGGSLNPIALIGGSKTGLRSPVGVAIDAKGNIYVVNAKGGGARKGSVTVYRRGSHGNVRPTAVIAGARTGLFRPAGIALDSTGAIFVTNQAGESGHGSVTEFRAGSRGNAAPIRKIAGSRTRLKNPVGIAVAAHGDIYVANDSGGAGTIEVFRPGSTGNVAPARTINGSCSGMDGPQGVAVDSAGNVYVSNDGQRLGGHASGITVYSADSDGCATPAATICGNDTGLSQPSGLMLDSKRNIYVTDLAPDSVAMSVFAPPETIPATQPTPSPASSYSLNSGFGVPFSGSFGGTLGSQSLGCTALTPSEGNAPPIAVFANSNNQPYAEMDRPYGVALDKSGRIYVANGGTAGRGVDSITVYPAGSNANVSPIATIVGDGGDRSNDKTGLGAPSAIALDTDGYIYVASDDSYSSKAAISAHAPSVTIYAAGSNGNIAPTATIQGRLTQLAMPSGIAVDSIGNIYVADAPSWGGAPLDSITVYPPQSDGNIAPAMRLSDGRIIRHAVIKGSRTGLNQPAGMAIGPN